MSDVPNFHLEFLLVSRRVRFLPDDSSGCLIFLDKVDHFSDRLLYPDYGRPGYDGETDAEFCDLRDSGNRKDIFLIQAMSGVNFQPKIVAAFRGPLYLIKSFLAFLSVFQIRILSCVDLDQVNTHPVAGFDLF